MDVCNQASIQHRHGSWSVTNSLYELVISFMKHRLDVVTHPRVLYTPDNCTPTHYYSAGNEAMKTRGTGVLLGCTARPRRWGKLQIPQCWKSKNNLLLLLTIHWSLFEQEEVAQAPVLSTQPSFGSPIRPLGLTLQAGEVLQIQNCNCRHRGRTK